MAGEAVEVGRFGQPSVKGVKCPPTLALANNVRSEGLEKSSHDAIYGGRFQMIELRCVPEHMVCDYGKSLVACPGCRARTLCKIARMGT